MSDATEHGRREAVCGYCLRQQVESFLLRRLFPFLCSFEAVPNFRRGGHRGLRQVSQAAATVDMVGGMRHDV